MTSGQHNQHHGRARMLLPLALIWTLMAPSLRAQDDEDELPDEPSATEGDLNAAEVPDPAPASDVPVKDPKDAGAASTVKDEQSSGPLWESYDSEASASVAQEVTSGVRVEDIVEPPSDFRFAAFGKPDPFVPPLMASEDQAGGAGIDPLEIPIVSPLQRFALQDLSLVGIWELASGERKAMVLTKGSQEASQGIIVKNGDPVGNRGGKILAIGADFVTVREFTLAPDGTRQYDDQQLTMTGKDQGELSGKIRFTPGVRETEVILDQPDGTGAPKASEKTPLDQKAAVGEANQKSNILEEGPMKLPTSNTDVAPTKVAAPSAYIPIPAGPAAGAASPAYPNPGALTPPVASGGNNTLQNGAGASGGAAQGGAAGQGSAGAPGATVF